MLTIFTTCKPCNVETQIGDMGKIVRVTNGELQKKAMLTWKHLDPQPEVIVLGQDQGTAELADELGFRHIPDVKMSEYNTPMMDDMFAVAEKHASNDVLALISSDVYLLSHPVKALKFIQEKFDKFCAICRKTQQRYWRSVDLGQSDWRDKLIEGTRLNLITSGDFYMFSKGYWGQIPPFVIGRCACDSWLFWESARQGTMIDLSNVLTIVDFNHRHEHWGENRVGDKERDINRKLAEGKKADIRDANWVMNKDYTIKENK